MIKIIIIGSIAYFAGFIHGIYYTVAAQSSTLSKLIIIIAKTKGVAEVLFQ